MGGAIVTAIGLFSGNIIGPLAGMTTMVGGLKNMVSSISNMVSGLSAAFQQGLSAVTSLVAGLAKSFYFMFRMEAIIEVIKTAFGGILVFIESFVSEIEKAWPKLNQLFKVLSDSLKVGDMDLAGQALARMFKAIGNAIWDSFKKATDYMYERLMGLFGTLFQMFSTVGSYFSGGQFSKQITSMSKDFLDFTTALRNYKRIESKPRGKPSAEAEVDRFLAKKAEEIKMGDTAVGRSLGSDFIKNMLKSVPLYMSEALRDVSYNFNDRLLPSIIKKMSVMFDPKADFATRIVNAILLLGDIFTFGITTLINFLGQTLATVLNNIVGMGGLAYQVSQGTKNFSIFLYRSLGAINDFAQGLLFTASTINKFNMSFINWQNKLSSFFNWIQTINSNVFDKVFITFATFKNKLFAMFSSGSNQFAKLFPGLAAWITSSTQWMRAASNGGDPERKAKRATGYLGGILASLVGAGGVGGIISGMAQWGLNFYQSKEARGTAGDRRAAANARIKEARGEISKILDRVLGGANLSRSAGAMGIGAAALAGTRYQSVDMQQLEELRIQSGILARNQEILKNMKPVKFKKK